MIIKTMKLLQTEIPLLRKFPEFNTVFSENFSNFIFSPFEVAFAKKYVVLWKISTVCNFQKKVKY